MNEPGRTKLVGFGITAVTVVVTVLICSGTVAVGIDSQWKYGLMRDAETPMAPVPPSYGNIWIAVLGLVALLSMLHFGLRHIGTAGRFRQSLLVGGLLLCGMLQFFGLVVVSRAGIGEPSLVHFCDWSGGFFNDAVRLREETDPVARYSAYQSDLSLHGRWHPPGPMLVNLWAIRFFESHPQLAQRVNELFRSQGVYLQGSWWLIQRVGEEMGHPPAPEVREADIAACHLMAWLLLAVALSCVVPIYLLGKELTAAEVGFLAGGFYVVVPALCFFQPMMDLVYAVFTVWALWFHARGLRQDNEWVCRLYFAAAGATLGFGLFFSYNQLAVLPLVAVWTACEQWRQERQSLVRLLDVGSSIVVGLGSACFAVWIWAEYDLVRDFFTRDVGRSWDWGTKLGQAPTNRPYSTWIWMNLVEYFTFVGIPLAAGFVMSGTRGLLATAKRTGNRGHAAAAALVVSILLLDLTGVNRSEVARLWIFLMPMTAVIAATTVVSYRSQLWLFTVSLWAQALAFKLTLTTNNFIN